LETDVANYKSRLDELRKAKSNLIIKKTTEYVNTGPVAAGLHFVHLANVFTTLIIKTFNFLFEVIEEIIKVRLMAKLIMGVNVNRAQ